MDIPSNLIPDAWLWMAALVFILLLMMALYSAPWAKLGDNEANHVYFGAIALLAVLWTLRAGIIPGLNYHLLGVTALCLMFDWQFALLAVSLVVTLVTSYGPAGWESLPLNVLLMGALPIGLTRLLLTLAQRYLPLNFFVYIFFNAFMAGGLASLLTGLAAATVFLLSGVHGADALMDNHIPSLVLLFFPEGFLNGLVMTVLVVYRPRWVSTFHDRWYLDGK